MDSLAQTRPVPHTQETAFAPAHLPLAPAATRDVPRAHNPLCKPMDWALDGLVLGAGFGLGMGVELALVSYNGPWLDWMPDLLARTAGMGIWGGAATGLGLWALRERLSGDLGLGVVSVIGGAGMAVGLWATSTLTGSWLLEHDVAPLVMLGCIWAAALTYLVPWTAVRRAEGKWVWPGLLLAGAAMQLAMWALFLLLAW